MGTKGRENWEKFKAGYVVDSSHAEDPSTGNAGRDRWNALKKTIDIRSTAPRQTVPEETSGEDKGFFKRAGLTISGGAKGSLAGNMDAMGAAYEAGQSGRTKRDTAELRDAQWAVARIKRDYDADPSKSNESALKIATAKMKAFADVLGEGAYEQALEAAYNAAAQLDTGDLKALYNGLGVVTPKTGTGVQQRATKAARDLAVDVQGSAAEDIQSAKEGTSKFWQMAIDAAASSVQMGIDAASNALLGTQGSMIPFAARAFGGATMEARQDGADLGKQALYGAAQTAKEVFTEKMFNIALPYAKTYGKGGLDGIVENGIRKAADKLGESKAGKTALEKVLTFGASAASEGLEELVGDWMEWQLPRIYGGEVDTAEETLSNSLYDFVVGSMAGAIGGAVAEPMKAVNSAIQEHEVKKAYGARQRDLVNESEELNPGNELAKKYRERLDGGKNLSGKQLMRLMQQNETDTLNIDKSKIQAATEKRLTELGESGNVPELAGIVAKQTAGEELSPDEQARIDGSKYGKRVLNELNPENVKVDESGNPRDTYSSSWTGSIGTSAINPITYNRNIGVTGAKYNPETQKLDAIVKDSEGNIQTVPLKEAKASLVQEELFDWAEDLKEAGPVMVGAYQATQNLELYARSFRLAYEYGKAHMPMDYVENSEGVNYLHPVQLQLAYEEGAKAQQRQTQAAEEKIASGGTQTAAGKKKPTVSLRGATVGGNTYAPVDRKTLNRRQWASVEAMRALSKATGMDVVFYQSQANEKGEYEGANGFFRDGTIYLDINAGRNSVQDVQETAVLKTAAHELTHFIQRESPTQYEELKQFVVERLVQQEGVSFEDIVTDKQRREPDLSYNEAVDEVVADACEMMLKDSTAAERLANENRSLARRIADWLRKWVRSIKVAMEGLKAERPESVAMMQYAEELQKLWDNALVDAARNGRGTMRENAPAEVKQQARVGTSESIKPDEKSLKGKRDDGKMDAVKDLLKEDLDGGEERKEDRGAFLRRATGEGLRIFEGDSIAYGYRTVPWGSAGENARQVQKELTALGVDAEITEGYVHWNLNGISSRRAISQAVTIEKRKVLISNRVSLPSKNAAGHEAFHFWGSTQAREAYADELSDNLNFSSKEFVEYQAVIAEAYLGGEADLSDSTQLQKLREELFAYISGDIHEGVNDDLLRPMFHDYDAVKAAWVKLCKDRAGGKAQFQQREPKLPDRSVLSLAAELMQGLEKQGATVRKYKAGDEQSRLEAVNADERVRFSVREVGGETMPVLNIQNDTRDYKVAEAYLKTLVDTEHPFATILVDAQPVYIGKDLPGEYKGSEYTHRLNRSTRQVKMQAATNLDEMLLLAENGEWRDNVKDKHKWDAKNGWYRYSTRFALPVLDIKKAVDHYTVYSGTLLIRNDADGKSYLYDLLDIKKEKVISSPSFSARERSEVFEPKPSQKQYMQNSQESQAENSGKIKNQQREPKLPDRSVLSLAAELMQGLEKQGATVRKYKAGDERSRLAAVNEDENVRFSKREKYWHPKLSRDEWNLLNRRMNAEVQSGKNFVDESTKWVYADEKGVQVFALYGVGDGTEATPLYAVGGMRARMDAKEFIEHIKERERYDGNRENLDALLEGYGHSVRRERGDLFDRGGRQSKGKDAGLYGRQQGRDAGGASEGGAEDQRGITKQNQQREPRMSDRDVLRMAARLAKNDRSNRWTVEDKNRLELLVGRMLRLDEINAELAALQEERTTILGGRKKTELKGEDRDELIKTENRIQIAKDRIKREEGRAFELVSMDVYKPLLKKARDIVERDTAAQARTEYREKREAAEQMAVTQRKIERTAKRLTEYMTTNTDKKHIPEALKKPIGELLSSLNFYSGSARRGGRMSRADLQYLDAMQSLQNAILNQRAYEERGVGEDLFRGYLDLPSGFENLLAEHMDRVKRVVEERPLKTTVVREMDLDDLKELDVILSVMSRSVTKMNEMFVNRRFGLVSDAAENSINTMSVMGQHQDKTGESFVLWDNTLPWYAFQRFGEGGKAVFEALQDGWDKLAFNTKMILDFRKGLIPDELARKWDTEIHEVELTDPDGSKVHAKLTTTQLMSLHCLSKRKQALGHLLGGGIRPYAVELTEKKAHKLLKKTLKQDKQFKLTEESLGQLLRLLTPEQVKAADAMQKFMTEQGSAWGNEVSMARFGYRAFTERNYFPIETDKQDGPAKTGDATEGSLYRLQNISAVKPLTKNANNALVLRGIFDVFANHTADMAKYNALVLPILDAQKWYNYKYASKNEAGQVSTRTVQRAMTRAYGASANNYVVKYLQDLNGVKESSDRGDKLATKMISNYKRAMVAANLRVAVLQPTAYARASAVLDYKYLTAAFADKTGTKQAAEEMKQYSGIALWKSLGFFDTDVGRSMRDQIKGTESKLENLVDKSMKPAEWGDEITWARLWRACKLEVKSTQKLTGEELLEATAKRFREVVYRTQVVDSTMTRSHMMRSSSTMSKMVTSFMSEPTVSYNMVMDSTAQIAQDAKKMGLRVAIRRNWKTAGRSYQAYIVSAVVTAIVESLYDALRDTDDDEYLDKVWKAFGGEKPETVKDQVLGAIFGLNGNLAGDINPISKLPLLRDVVSIFGGYDNGRTDTEAIANLKKAIDIWDEAIRLKTGELDKATRTTYYGNMTTYGMIYPTAQALSQLSGLPASTTMREVVTAWNNTVGIAFPQMKRRTYENKKLREAWDKYGKSSGISYAAMFRAVEAMRDIEGDKDEDGNTVSGSQKAKYLEYIRSLGLTSAQEYAVWQAAKVTSWSDKGTPWG